mgnify:CR=1 FL=1
MNELSAFQITQVTSSRNLLWAKARKRYKKQWGKIVKMMLPN